MDSIRSPADGFCTGSIEQGDRVPAADVAKFHSWQNINTGEACIAIHGIAEAACYAATK